VLTTQLYFPDEPDNEGDGIYRPELEMDLQDADQDDADAGKLGYFTFVLDLG
jgi:protocatechuate 3,4-dioxygenase beta subunit